MTQESAKIYPYEGRLEIQGKCSVSEIKRQSQIQEQKEEPENQGIVLIKEPEDTATVPKFLEAKEEKSGGTKRNCHASCDAAADFTARIPSDRWKHSFGTSKEKADKRRRDIAFEHSGDRALFFRTDIGKRAADAARRGQLYREKQFVIGVPASDIRPQWDKEEMVLVQGIIDAWFYEGDQIVLLDYKTDRVLKGQEQKLKERYQAQLDYYAKALKQTTGHEVKGKKSFMRFLCRRASLFKPCILSPVDIYWKRYGCKDQGVDFVLVLCKDQSIQKRSAADHKNPLYRKK